MWWLFIFGAAFMRAQNTCNYVKNVAGPFASPIDVCVLELEIDGIITIPIASKYTCDNGEVMLSSWRYATECDANVTPTSVKNTNATDFNCDAPASCAYGLIERYVLSNDTTCIPGTTPMIGTVTFGGSIALLYDECHGMEMISECDSSGKAPYIQYANDNCTGNITLSFDITGAGICRVIGDSSFFVADRMCSVSSNTSDPITATDNPTVVTSNPTISTGIPTSATSNPTISTNSPTMATGNPTISTGNPTSATSNPTISTGNPTISTSNPTMAMSDPESTSNTVEYGQQSIATCNNAKICVCMSMVLFVCFPFFF